jgi:transcription elongation GreA/GreB family factor
MHADLEKLVEAGKVNAALAERLNQVSPGSYLLHPSWGAGKVVGWDLPNKKLKIDFEQRSGQSMDLQFALQKTTPLEADDFRARKVEELEQLRELAKSDPVELVILLLRSHDGSMTVDALEKEISGSVVPEEDFKKWWEGAKRALRENKRVIVPARRTGQLTLRSGDLTPAEALLEDFGEARDLKAMVKALEAIASDSALFKPQPEALDPVLQSIDETSKKSAKMQFGPTLELLSLRDELVATLEGLELPGEALRLSNLLLAEEDRLAAEIGGLPTARQRTIYEVFPDAFGDRWVEVILGVFDEVGSRAVTEISRLIIERGEREKLEAHIGAALARRSLSADALIWVARERRGEAKNMFSQDIGAAMLSLLESDHLADGPRTTTRLQSLLNDDKQLLTDIVESMAATEAKNFGRRLLECPVFSDLDRKSLMARIIKARPETGELVSGEKSKKEETLIVSWDSLKRKQKELDDLVRTRIPQNTKDIAIARSYGDLRENFEYKSSKDMQKVLMRRKSELEKELELARGTDFSDADTAAVNIGTIVDLKNERGETARYSVMGAWDSDPEKGMLSYLSEAGAALLGAVPGQQIEIRDPLTDVMQTWTVESISTYQSHQT